MPRSALACAPLALALSLFLGSCGGEDNPAASGGAITVAPAPSPSPSPSPTPPNTPGNPPVTSNQPPAPFGLTRTTPFELVGWQEISQGDASSLVAPADQKGSLTWSAELNTYRIALADLDSGRLVYTFAPPASNPLAFSIVNGSGLIAKAYVTLIIRTPNTGEIFWQTSDGVTPFIRANALFGIPATPANLPSTGKRIFRTDSSPESAIIFDFATRTVSGTVTSFDDGGPMGPVGPKEQATLEPAQIAPDGSFVAILTVPGAPRKGELRGRLFGPSGTELAVFWNAPVRDGYGMTFRNWLDVMYYAVCETCPG